MQNPFYQQWFNDNFFALGLVKDGSKTLRDLHVTKGAKMMVVGSTINDVLKVTPPPPSALKEEKASGIHYKPCIFFTRKARINLSYSRWHHHVQKDLKMVTIRLYNKIISLIVFEVGQSTFSENSQSLNTLIR